MSETIEFFKKYGKCICMVKTSKDPCFAKFPPIICNDGTFISAQAGVNYRCYPRKNLDSFEYETVEVLRNEELDNENLIYPFMCDYDTYIYADVPIKVIDVIISRHGGIDYSSIEKYIAEANK